MHCVGPERAFFRRQLGLWIDGARGAGHHILGLGVVINCELPRATSNALGAGNGLDLTTVIVVELRAVTHRLLFESSIQKFAHLVNYSFGCQGKHAGIKVNKGPPVTDDFELN